MLVTAYQRRTCQLDVTIIGVDGLPVTLGTGDVVRVKVGRDNETPILDIDSAAPTPNGSSVAAANPARLMLHQDDLTFTAGAYDIEVGIVDDSEGDLLKHAEKGVFVLHATQLGDVALT